MIIGIDASRANRPQKTGTEWYAYHIIRSLAAIDSRNQYILYSDQPFNPELAEICLKQANFQAKVLSWPFRRLWTLGRLTLEMLINPPDVLFVPSHVLPLWSRAKLVNTIHDVGFMAVKQLYNWQERQYLRWSTSYALHQAKCLIAVSNFTKQEIGRYFPTAPSSKIAVVYHGYDQELYHLVTEAVDDRPVIAKYQIKSPYLLYIGRLESKKNINGLLNGFRQYCQDHLDDSISLVLAGQRSHDYAAVNNLLTDPILKKRVLELGWVPEHDLPCLLRQAVGLVFPSWYEGFGLPLLQAMACGTPVLAANTGALPEIAGSAALYFDPIDTVDLADKISQLINDVSLRQRLSQDGLARAADFSWQKAAAETLIVLEQANV
jgi:glycosyltransferase involved in cell wall biosynthesis